MAYILYIDNATEPDMTNLETKAAALVAANRAKYKAMGMTHRVEMHICKSNGAYIRTEVFYIAGSHDMARLARFALKAGTKSISASVDSAQVEAL